KGIPLHRYQLEWCNWGAICVFIGVLLIVLLITLADPVVRLFRLELRYLGKQQETILTAKSDALESERIQTAMANRADSEAEIVAEKIEGNAGFPRHLETDTRHRSGYRANLVKTPEKATTHVSLKMDDTSSDRKTTQDDTGEGLKLLRETLKLIAFHHPGQ